jgi:hypothetical protein
MVVNYCDVAANAYNQTVPDSCVTDYSVSETYLDKVKIYHKFTRQSFNPVNYRKLGHMDYVGTGRMESDFLPNITVQNKFSVQRNAVNFFMSLFVDLSSLKIFPSTDLVYYSS